MMRKSLFHPTPFYQQKSYSRTRGNHQLSELYATQPEHVVHSILYRIEDQEQDLSNYNSFSEVIDSTKNNL